MGTSLETTVVNTYRCMLVGHHLLERLSIEIDNWLAVHARSRQKRRGQQRRCERGEVHLVFSRVIEAETTPPEGLQVDVVTSLCRVPWTRVSHVVVEEVLRHDNGGYWKLERCDS